MSKFDDASDEVLCSYVVNGDSLAEEYLVKKFSRLVRICARPYFLAGGDSEDLIQEGMLGLLSAIREYNPEENASFKTFAELCIRRRLFTAIKTASRNKHIPLNECISFESTDFDGIQSQFFYSSGESILRDPEEQILARERADEIKTTLSGGLSRLELKVLELYLNGLSYQDIAIQLKKSTKSVDNAVQRIRKKLARQLSFGENR